MNYIHQLKMEAGQKQAELNILKSQLDGLKSFLHSDKFKGVEPGGGRKDWIATGDLLNWINETNSAAMAAGEVASAEYAMNCQAPRETQLT